MNLKDLLETGVELYFSRQKAQIHDLKYVGVTDQMKAALLSGVKQGYEDCLAALRKCDEKGDASPVYDKAMEQMRLWDEVSTDSTEAMMSQHTRMQMIEYLINLMEAEMFLDAEEDEERDEIRQDGRFTSEHMNDILLISEILDAAREEPRHTVH